MSAVHRALGRGLGRLAARLAAVDTDRLLGVVVAVGVLAAVVIVALAGFLTGLTESFLATLLYVFALLLPVCGFLLVAFVVRRQLRAERAARETIRHPPPEEGTTEADWSVGRDARHELREATASQYRCQAHPSAEKIRNRLRHGAIGRTRTRHGYDEETARSLVAAGEWTDDPVAAAFFSEEVPYPLGERLRAAVDPGAAYRRRVRRTLDAIERHADRPTDGKSAGGRSASEESSPEREDGAAQPPRNDAPLDGQTGEQGQSGTSGEPVSETATGTTDAEISEVVE